MVYSRGNETNFPGDRFGLGEGGPGGRRLARVRERETHLAAYRTSGLTQRRFAAQAGINFHTFCIWLQKSRGGSRRGGAAGGQSFIEVRRTPSAGTNYLVEVTLPSGIMIRGQTSGAVAEVVRALR